MVRKLVLMAVPVNGVRVGRVDPKDAYCKKILNQYKICKDIQEKNKEGENQDTRCNSAEVPPIVSQQHTEKISFKEDLIKSVAQSDIDKCFGKGTKRIDVDGYDHILQELQKLYLENKDKEGKDKDEKDAKRKEQLEKLALVKKYNFKALVPMLAKAMKEGQEIPKNGFEALFRECKKGLDKKGGMDTKKGKKIADAISQLEAVNNYVTTAKKVQHKGFFNYKVPSLNKDDKILKAVEKGMTVIDNCVESLVSAQESHQAQGAAKQKAAAPRNEKADLVEVVKESVEITEPEMTENVEKKKKYQGAIEYLKKAPGICSKPIEERLENSKDAMDFDDMFASAFLSIAKSESEGEATFGEMPHSKYTYVESKRGVMKKRDDVKVSFTDYCEELRQELFENEFIARDTRLQGVVDIKPNDYEPRTEKEAAVQQVLENIFGNIEGLDLQALAKEYVDMGIALSRAWYAFRELPKAAGDMPQDNDDTPDQGGKDDSKKQSETNQEGGKNCCGSKKNCCGSSE